MLQVDTEACEQCFSWLSRYARITRRMQRSTFSRDVLGCPRTSWTWDSGTLHCLHRWTIPGCPGTSWTWDSGTLYCLYGVDIPGYPGVSQDILDLGLWDLILPLWRRHPRISWSIPGHLGPGTLGPYTASTGGPSQDVLEYPRTSWTWDSGTLHCLHSVDIPGCPGVSQDILDLGLWDLIHCLHGVDIPG